VVENINYLSSSLSGSSSSEVNKEKVPKGVLNQKSSSYPSGSIPNVSGNWLSPKVAQNCFFIASI
jgi:hypothetical protein